MPAAAEPAGLIQGVWPVHLRCRVDRLGGPLEEFLEVLLKFARDDAWVRTVLDRLDREVLPTRQHALLGRPSLHASTVEGGIGLSTYPDRCVVRLERRTIPGETGDDAVRELQSACDQVRRDVADFRADVDLLFAQPPSDVAPDAPIARTITSVLAHERLDPAPLGMSAWTDAALLNAAGIPAVCFGPGDMGLAHAAEEYIDLPDVERAADVLVAVARAWCN